MIFHNFDKKIFTSTIPKMTRDFEKELQNIRKNRDVSFFDFCSIDDATSDDLNLIFELARKFRETKTAKLNLCRGKSMINAFFENSTRTQSSFDLSGKHLSMDTNNVGSSSSVAKGESFIDTAQTLDAYNVAVIVVRASQSGVPKMISKHVGAAVVNAGDGWHEHPTQALLDALTMLDHCGQKDLSGKKIAIVGDIAHSRVFGSFVRILKKLNIAEARVAAPETFFPEKVENFGIRKFYSIEDALDGVDFVYALRVQEERGAKSVIPSLREYSKTFGITQSRLKLASKNAILLHPGPVIRDIDVHSALVSRSNQSHILNQVENGMAVRKTILWLLAERFDGRVKSYKLI